MQIAVVALALLAPNAAPGGTATGSFTLGEESIAPRHAIAFQTRRGAASEPTTIVFLSEVPADADAAVRALDPLTAVINQPGPSDSNYITLSVTANGTASMNATFSEGMRQYIATSAIGGLKVEWTERTATRLAGHAFTPSPVPTRGGPAYALDVRFEVAVTGREGGTPLPADGGEPGQALLALVAASEAGDLEKMRHHVSAGLADEFDASYNTPEENLESARERLRISLPASRVAIVRGTAYGDEAIVEVQGEVFEDTRALYRVRMVQREGRWVFDAGQMAGYLE